MRTAAAAYRPNNAPDFTLADDYDPQYLDVPESEEPEIAEAERQRLNAEMFSWFFGI